MKSDHDTGTCPQDARPTAPGASCHDTKPTTSAGVAGPATGFGFHRRASCPRAPALGAHSCSLDTPTPSNSRPSNPITPKQHGRPPCHVVEACVCKLPWRGHAARSTRLLDGKAITGQKSGQCPVSVCSVVLSTGSSLYNRIPPRYIICGRVASTAIKTLRDF